MGGGKRKRKKRKGRSGLSLSKKIIEDTHVSIYY